MKLMKVSLILLVVALATFYVYFTNRLPEGVEEKGNEASIALISLITAIISILGSIITFITAFIEFKSSKAKKKPNKQKR